MIAARQIAFGKAAGAKKPYDAEIEYLESTGTQYIDTGISNLNDVKWTIRQALLEYVNNRSLSGVVGSAGAKSVQRIATNNAYGTNLIILQRGATDIGRTQVEDDGLFHTYTLSKGEATIDNNTVTGTFDIIEDFNVNIYLFTALDSLGTVTSGLPSRISKAKIWLSGILVRDFIPVRVGNIGYMYDRVSGQLFGNQGTGEFVLGPDLIDYTAKDYIQNDLGVAWDSIENVSFGNTDLGATQWDSLVGGATLQLPSGAVFTDRGLHIDRTKTYRSTTISAAPFFEPYCQAIDNRTLTFECVYQLDDYGASVSTSLLDRARNTFSVSRYYGLFCPMSASQVYLNSNQSGDGNYWVVASKDPTGKHSLSAVYTPSGTYRVHVKIYMDGVLIGEKEIPTSAIADENVTFANLKSGSFLIGPITSTNGASVDFLNSFRIYNRALTAEEVAHNYNIDKQRFGL